MLVLCDLGDVMEDVVNIISHILAFYKGYCMEIYPWTEGDNDE